MAIVTEVASDKSGEEIDLFALQNVSQEVGAK